MKKEYTYEELTKKYKLTDLEIGFLIDEELLTKINNNCFILESLENIKNYGDELIEEHEYESGLVCLDIYHKFVHNNPVACLKHLLSKLKYDSRYKMLNDYVNNCSIDEENNICMMYLYLLSFLVEVPKEYFDIPLEVPENLNLKGMETSGEKVCELIKRAKYKDAIRMLACTKKQYSHELDFEVMKFLLNEVIDHEDKFKKDLVELVKNKEYDKLRKILLDKQSIRPLSERETHILLIVDAIIKALNGEYLKPVRDRYLMHKFRNNYEKYDLMAALIRNEFKLAEIINFSHLLNYYGKNQIDINIREDIVNVLLEDLNFIIRKLNGIDIEEIEFLSEYLLTKGLNLKNTGLPLEDMILIKLVRAINCYKEGFIDYGNALISHVKNNFEWRKVEEDRVVIDKKLVKELIAKAMIIREEAKERFTIDGELTKPKADFKYYELRFKRR